MSCICRTTEKLAQDFQNGAGKQLHEELVAQDKNNKHTSYISGNYDYSLKLSIKDGIITVK